MTPSRAAPIRTIALQRLLASEQGPFGPARDRGALEEVLSAIRTNTIKVPEAVEPLSRVALQPVVPACALRAAIALLPPQRFRCALDPWAEMGLLLGAIAEAGIVSAGVGVGRGGEAARIGRAVTESHGLRWEEGDGYTWLDGRTDAYDLIVSMPPFGMPIESWTAHPDEREVDLRDQKSYLLIAKSCSALTEDGVALFVVSPSFFIRGNAKCVAANLSALGLSVDAVIYFPRGAFGPWTAVRGAFVRIRRGAQERVFVGEWSEEERRVGALLTNLQNRIEGRDVGLGRLVAWEDFRGLEAIEAADRSKQLAMRIGHPASTLGALATAVTLARRDADEAFDEKTNAIYVPLIGESDVVTSVAALRLKPQNYAQIALDPAHADAMYLAGFFNTALGKSVRAEGRSGIIPKLSRPSVAALRVYVPPIAVQQQVGDAASAVAQLTAEMRERRERLWTEPRSLSETVKVLRKVSREETFVEWLDRLPFPLASILWIYRTDQADEKRSYEHLAHFFEALAEFLSIVLLSAARTPGAFSAGELERGLAEALGRSRSSMAVATFGTWNTILGHLGKRFRTLMSGEDDEKARCEAAFRTSDREVIAMLTSKELVSVLQEAANLRNEWIGHTGIVGDREAAARHRAFSVLLGRVRPVFGTAWDRYLLIQPGATKISGGVYRYSVRKVVGRCAPFERSDIELSEPMEDGRLHLLGEGERAGLQLLRLVRLGGAPASTENACYFYNRSQQGAARFVSYHFDQEAEIVEEGGETLDVLRALTSTEGIG